MNDVVSVLINYKYKNESLNKRVSIYKNTKNNRIKNKQFVKILVNAIKERKIIRCGDLVLLDIPVYNELKKATITENTE